MEQAKIRKLLDEKAKGKNLSHAYILEGNNCYSIADEFAKSITPYHEDIIYVKADGLSVKDKKVENLQSRLAMKPMVGLRNVAIIDDAETMTVRAQNRLLKTLEEPPGYAVIILLTQNVENLLSTIRSRCVLYRIDEEETVSQIELEAREQAKTIGKMILEEKSFLFISEALKSVISEKERAYAFLDALENWCRDLLFFSVGLSEKDTAELYELNNLLKRETLYRTVELIEEARRDLNQNINAGYAIKSMLLKLI